MTLTTLRDDIRSAISNAYYENRNKGQTMETAADDAAEAVDALIAAVRAEQAAEVERLRATMEKARVTAMTMLLGERVCEKSHRDGERNAHVHVEVVHGWAVALAPFARAALAATPVAPEASDERR